VSNDGNEEAFERNFSEMPWCSVPLTDSERSQNLRQQFGISGIPSLVILHKDCEFVSMDGRADIQQNKEGAFDLWAKNKQVAQG
jgi:hypothetical protein